MLRSSYAEIAKWAGVPLQSKQQLPYCTLPRLGTGGVRGAIAIFDWFCRQPTFRGRNWQPAFQASNELDELAPGRDDIGGCSVGAINSRDPDRVPSDRKTPENQAFAAQHRDAQVACDANV